jgi:hypothetical protein
LLCLKGLLFDAGRQDLAMVCRAMRGRGIGGVLARVGVPGKARLGL